MDSREWTDLTPSRVEYVIHPLTQVVLTSSSPAHAGGTDSITPDAITHLEWLIHPLTQVVLTSSPPAHAGGTDSILMRVGQSLKRR